MKTVDAVRSFNRFYTRQMGLLNEHLPASDLSLAEARVLYELATGGEQTSADLCRTLHMDKAHMSRVLARFKGRRYVHSRSKPENAKHILLSLRPTGKKAFAQLNEGTNSQIQSMLKRLPPQDRRRLTTCFREITAILGAERATAPVTLRRLKVGDFGYITYRQAVLYNQEYGWDWTYEALAAEILAKYVKNFDPKWDDGWIAQQRGLIVGSIFLMRGDEAEVARLRLLYVEPSARGSGIGRKLVDKCIKRARDLGYKRLVLWTNDVLLSARRIYEATGFKLVEQNSHRSFGKDLIGQTWALDLR